MFARIFQILVILLLFCGNYNAKGQPVAMIETLHYEKGSLDDLKALSKQHNRNIFVKCYTKWCRTCKFLDKHVLNDPDLVQYFNQNMIVRKVNMEKREGAEYIDAYKVDAYPTLLILNSKGEVLDRFEGSLSPAELIEKAKKFVK